MRADADLLDAPGDAVDAHFAYDSRGRYTLGVHAWSGPDGAGATSTEFHDGRSNVDRFEGRVTCLAVQGDRAAIGGVGTFVALTGERQPATDRVTLAPDPSGTHTVARQITLGTTPPPNCATASFANQFAPALGRAVVQDG